MHDTATQEVNTPPSDLSMFGVTVPGAKIASAQQSVAELTALGALEASDPVPPAVHKAMCAYLDLQAYEDRIGAIVDRATPEGTKRRIAASDASFDLFGALTDNSELWALLMDVHPDYDPDAERHRILAERKAVAESAGTVWPEHVSEYLDQGLLPADSPGGTMTDQLISDVGSAGFATTLENAEQQAGFWQGLLDNPEGSPFDDDVNIVRCAVGARYLVQLLAGPNEQRDRWLAACPLDEVADQRARVVDYLDAEARPYEFRLAGTPAPGLRSSVTGEPITGGHVVVYDRIEDKAGPILAPADIQKLAGLVKGDES